MSCPHLLGCDQMNTMSPWQGPGIMLLDVTSREDMTSEEVVALILLPSRPL